MKFLSHLPDNVIYLIYVYSAHKPPICPHKIQQAFVNKKLKQFDKEVYDEYLNTKNDYNTCHNNYYYGLSMTEYIYDTIPNHIISDYLQAFVQCRCCARHVPYDSTDQVNYLQSRTDSGTNVCKCPCRHNGRMLFDVYVNRTMNQQ
jgi:hypothetical protein